MGDIKRLLRDIGYFGVFALMVLGIIGVMYHAVGKDGWIDKFMGEVIARGVSVAIGVVVGIAAVVWLGRRVLHATRTNALFNDILMYGFMALGMWFLGRLILSGSF